MGMVFFGLLPLPGLLAVTAFLFGLVIVLFIHARRAQPWGAVLVRAGVALVVLWLAVTAGSITLMNRLTTSGPLDGGYAATDAAGRLFVHFALATVLLLALAGGLLAWIASASRRRMATATLESRRPA